VLDERWDEQQQQLADGLRAVLAKECTPEHVREAEIARSLESLETALENFGLWDLGNDVDLLTVAWWELGRALAPISLSRVDVPDLERSILESARLVGASEGLLEVGVAYAKEREQFGQPIGAFQAVAHKLVDCAIAVDGAGLLVKKAAWLAGSGEGATTLADMARWKSAQAGRLTATHVHQAMGGYGFAIEEDCQLFSRRIRTWVAPPAGSARG
jgi:hypothetical protein